MVPTGTAIFGYWIEEDGVCRRGESVDRGWDEGEAEAMRTNFKTKLVCNKNYWILREKLGWAAGMKAKRKLNTYQFKTKLVCNKELLDLERDSMMRDWDEGETEAGMKAKRYQF